MPDKKMFRILLASNSQGTSSGVAYEKSYPNVLQKNLGREFEIHRILISGWTLRDLFNNFSDNVVSLSPDLVIMNFGIVESAQRILSNTEKIFFSLLPLGGRVTGFLHRNRAAVLRFRNSLGLESRQVSFMDYLESVKDVADCLNKYQIPYFFLRIPMFPDNGDSLGHPYINQDVEKYNRALGEYESIACDVGWTPNDYQPGTVHFSEAGHRKVADFLAREILLRLCPDKNNLHPAANY